MHGDYFWAKFIEDSYYFERPPPKTLAFNNNIFDGCRMISCGVPNSLQTRIFGEESFMWCHRTLCFAKYWNSLFQEKFKKLKIHHRKHKKCCGLNTLCLRSLVFPTRFDWQNISFCKTGVATTTIPTTTFNIFQDFSRCFQNVVRFRKRKHCTLYAISPIFVKGPFLDVVFEEPVSRTNTN